LEIWIKRKINFQPTFYGIPSTSTSVENNDTQLTAQQQILPSNSHNEDEKLI